MKSSANSSVAAVSLALSLLALLAVETSAGSHDPSLRLIETAPGKREWMKESAILELSRKSHREGHCGGFMDVTEHREKFAPIFAQPLEWFTEGALDPSHPDEVEPRLSVVSADSISETIRQLSNFHNRYYSSDTGVQAARWIQDGFTRMGQARSDFSVQSFTHSFRQPSVIARLEGQGPLKNEIVVLGAHLDSINQGFGWPNPQGRAPGADDDASGVATVMEVFRVLTATGFRPNRTMEFMGYAGEERGLLGSQDIAQRYRREGKKVVAVLHFDMTMFPGRSRQVTFIKDNVNEALTTFTQRLMDTYIKFPWTESTCGYACSDHASWNEAGYPAAYPFEAPFDEYNKKIHTPEDTLALLDATFGSHFAKLGVAFAVEMGLGTGSQ
jgi:leucyl aminopeptidase